MSKLVLINDIHYGIKSDALYMLDYQEKFFFKEFFPYLKDNNIDKILIGGDVFDRRKYINFNTLKRAKEMFFDIAKSMNIQIWIIPGNHDVVNTNTNRVNSIDLLLQEYDNITFIETPTTLIFDGISIDMIPWINVENYDDTMRFIADSNSDYLYGHLELAGFEMYAGSINEHGMSSEFLSKYKEVWSGHFHHRSKKGNILYTGAPMEFTFGDCDDERGFHVFDTISKDLTYIRNPYTLHEKIFYNDETEERQKYFKEMDFLKYEGKIVKLYCVSKTKSALFDYVIENLWNVQDIRLTVHEDYREFDGESVDLEEIKQKTTKDLIESYIDNVETDKDKNRLKDIMNTLYVEAVHNIENGRLE